MLISSTIVRSMRILLSQAKSLSLRELSELSMRAAFKIETVLIYCKDLEFSTRMGQKPQQAYMNIEKCELADLEILRKNMSNPLWEFLCDVYDGVKDCFVLKGLDGAINHISWLYYKGDPNRILELGSQDVEVKYSLTLPGFRGKGIYTNTLLAIQDYAKVAGYRNVFISVDEQNLPSRKGIEKAGFIFVSRLKLIKFAGIQINRRFRTASGRRHGRDTEEQELHPTETCPHFHE